MFLNKKLIFSTLAILLMGTWACQCHLGKNVAPAGTPNDDKNLGYELPAGLDSCEVEIRDINCFFHQGKFHVVGMVDNKSRGWQRVFLKVYFLDAEKKRIKVGGREEIYIPVAVEVIPPYGQSSFFWEFDAGSLASKPSQCDVKFVGAKKESERLQLILASDVSNIGIQVGNPKDPTAQPITIGTQISAKVYNPFDQVVPNPKAQIVMYGKDEKIWFVTCVPIDSTDQFIRTERSGDFRPKEERYVGGAVKHELLPEGIQTAGVGQILILPFASQNSPVGN